LDYFRHSKQLDQNFFQSLVQSVSIPVILTLRKESEGGQAKIEDYDRFNLLKKCLMSQPAYVDVEASLGLSKLRQLFVLADRLRVTLIVSYHNFKMTPSLKDTEELLDRQNRLCISANQMNQGHTQFILKHICTAQKYQDNLVPLIITQKYHFANQKIVCFCMSELGLYSRIMSLKVGALFTFGAFGETTAPGQVPIADFPKLLELDLKTWENYHFPQSELENLVQSFKF
jgi:3-dehydroquinate dehydratase I